MAGAGYKLFNTGDVLTAQQVNEYLQQQTVMVFASSAARTTALSGVLAEGMLSYLKDTDSTEFYNGSAWVGLALPSQTGNSGKYLTTNGTTASWGTVSGGGLTLIQETVASSSTGISFSSISSSYKQLMLVWDGCYHSASTTGFITRLNNDSSAIYDYWHIRANITGSTVGVGSGGINNAAIGQYTFNYDDTGNGNDVVAEGYILIDNYASTTKWKTYTFTYRWQSSGTTYLSVGNGRYRSTSAVTSLDIVRNTGTGTLNNVANTSIRLYGVA